MEVRSGVVSTFDFKDYNNLLNEQQQEEHLSSGYSARHVATENTEIAEQTSATTATDVEMTSGEIPAKSFIETCLTQEHARQVYAVSSTGKRGRPKKHHQKVPPGGEEKCRDSRPSNGVKKPVKKKGTRAKA